MSGNAKLEAAKSQPRGAWQFGLRSLMLVTLYVCVGLTLVRWWGVGSFIVVAAFIAPFLIWRRGRSPELAVLKGLLAYGAASIVTLPFLDSFWLGELPVLAILQLPKVEFANWLRGMLITDVMRPLGLSRGSISPDLIASRSYALALAYAIPLGIVLAAVWYRTRPAVPNIGWAIALVLVAIADFWMMLACASGPGLTIY